MLSCFSHRFIWTPTRKTPDPKVHFVQSLGQKPVEQLSGLLNLIDFFIVIVWHLTHSLVLPPALLMRSTYKPVPLKEASSIRATEPLLGKTGRDSWAKPRAIARVARVWLGHCGTGNNDRLLSLNAV